VGSIFHIDEIGDGSLGSAQGIHDVADPKTACRIYCKKAKGKKGYYSPAVRVAGSERSKELAYFPDGTYCHSDGKKDYYCLNDNCLAEGARGSRSHDESNYNLLSGANTVPESLNQYMTLGDDLKSKAGGSPVVDDKTIKNAEKEEEEKTTDKDYVEI
jgi:hypothetical protein